MTIRRGEPWGEPGALDAEAPVLDGDHAAARALQAAMDEGAPLNEIGLVAGDLHRTLGAPGRTAEGLYRGAGMRFPIDLGLVRLDGGPPLVFVAHLVATERRNGRPFASSSVVVMNGSFAGNANLGPRAHPNDGRLDLTMGAVPARDRRAATKRARTGTHVPHPGLSERRSAHHDIDAGIGGLWVRLDGHQVGRAHRLVIDCWADAVVVVV